MHNKILLFLICFLPLSVSAFDECGFNPTSIDSLFDFYRTNCSDRGPIPVCDCLKSQSKSNAFIKGLFDNQEDLKVTKEAYVVSQTKRLFSMYTQMTYGDAYQKKILGLEENPIVGCSSKDLAKHFEVALKMQMESDLPKSMERTAESRAKLDAINVKANQKCSELARILRQDVMTGNDKETSGALIKDLEEAKAYYLKVGNREKSDAASQAIYKIQHPSAAMPRSLSYALFTKPEVPRVNSLLDDREYCMRETQEYKIVMQEYFDDLSKNQRVGEVARDPGDPFQGLKDQIDNLNTKVTRDLQNSYDKVLPDACYTFSEYKVLSSRPSDALLDALIKTPAEELNSFFVPKDDISSSVEVQKLKFLRANPVLANTQTVPCAQNEVPGLMYEFAKQTQGKSPAEKAKAYIDFMKGDKIRSLLSASEVKLGAAQNCDNLGRNLAAVMLTDEPGPVPLFNVNNPLDMLGQQVLKCKISDKQELSKTNLTASLNANPLYLISDESVANSTSSSEDVDYRKFLAENCAGYEGHRQKYMEEACGHSADRPGCALKLGSIVGSQIMRDKYFEETASPQVKEINKIVHANTKTVFSPDDHKTVARVNREDAQDKIIRKIYATQVQPKMSRTVLAERGKEKSFTDEQTQNKQVVAAAAIPATVTPVQVAEPDWSKAPMPVITPTTLASAKPADLLPATYKDEAPEKQLQTIEDARENLVTAGEKLVNETKDPIEKEKVIADLKTSIENMDKEAEKVEKLVNASVPEVSSNVASSTSTVTSDQPVSPSTSGGSGSFSSVGNYQSAGAASSYVKSRVSEEDKVSEALLKTKYLDSEKSVDRSPASIDSDATKIVIGMPMVQAIPADAEVLSHLALDASSFGDKSLIIDKVKAELAKNKIQPNEKVLIQFYDKEKKEVLIVNVAWANNQWVISQVPRKSLLSNLNLTLIGQAN